MKVVGRKDVRVLEVDAVWEAVRRKMREDRGSACAFAVGNRGQSWRSRVCRGIRSERVREAQGSLEQVGEEELGESQEEADACGNAGAWSDQELEGANFVQQDQTEREGKGS
jgi:hypothetical protein